MIINTQSVLSTATRQYLYDWLDGAANSCLENDPGAGIFPNSDMADEIAAFRSSLLDDPQPIMKAVCEICGKGCTNANHPMKAVAVEPPLNVSERAELQALRRATCNHGFPPGVHTQGVIGCEKCSGRQVMIWELGGGHTHQIPGLKREEITPGMALHIGEEPPVSAEFKAARNTLKFLRYTWTGGEHWRPPLGLPPESVTGIDYKKLVEEISIIVFGNLEHVEHLPIVIRATFGRFHSWS